MPGGGGSVFIESPRRGGGFQGRLGGCLQRIGEFMGGGGGQIFFFRGRNVHQV